MVDFFDKVKIGISKSVTTASVKSKEFLEVSKVKNQINELQKQRRDSMEELGNVVYTMFLRDSFDEIRIKEKVSSIIKIDNQIKSMESEIIQIQNKARESLGESASTGKCSCGADLYEDTKFCSGCGNKVESIPSSEPSEEVPQSNNICGQCKTELESGSKFCNKCGTKAA